MRIMSSFTSTTVPKETSNRRRQRPGELDEDNDPPRIHRRKSLHPVKRIVASSIMAREKSPPLLLSNQQQQPQQQLQQNQQHQEQLQLLQQQQEEIRLLQLQEQEQSQQLQLQHQQQKQLQLQKQLLQEQQQPQQKYQLHQQYQSQLRQSQFPLVMNITTNDAVESDMEKNRKLLEWELSSLEANDLRSHAWYHGNKVDRIDAERLLRQCVIDEHGITSYSDNSSSRDEEESSNSDGLDQDSGQSSDDVENYNHDILLDEQRQMSDAFTASALLLKPQGHHIMLPAKKTIAQKRQGRHFYCFLVRDSMNIRPPGRYVVSCLRVDKYNADVSRKYDSYGNIGIKQSRKKSLCRQRKRRECTQQRHPVLHFVINEIILQAGTVYERSQFTFGDALPMATTTLSFTNNCEYNEQRKYQPGFDSIPDLIRYYVGGADDNAVLSYSGGNNAIPNNNSLFPHPTHTEVRIRYPCNRRFPLMKKMTSEEATAPQLISEGMDHVPVADQYSRALATAASLAEKFNLPDGITIMPADTSSLRRKNRDERKHNQSTPAWIRESSNRKTPSATITSATLSKSSSVLESTISNLPPRTISSHQSTSSLSKSNVCSQPFDKELESSLSFHDLLSLSSCPSLSASTSNSTSYSKFSSNSFTRSSTSETIKTLSKSSKLSCQSTSKKSNCSDPLSCEFLGTPSMSSEKYGTSDLSRRLSEDTTFKPQTHSPVGTSVINIDAEIAAALSKNIDDDDANFNDIFSINQQTLVQSSFDWTRTESRHCTKDDDNQPSTSYGYDTSKSRQISFSNQRDEPDYTESSLKMICQKIIGSQRDSDNNCKIQSSADNELGVTHQQHQELYKKEKLSLVSDEYLPIFDVKHKNYRNVVEQEKDSKQCYGKYENCHKLEQNIKKVESRAYQINEKKITQRQTKYELENSKDIKIMDSKRSQKSFDTNNVIDFTRTNIERWANTEIERLISENKMDLNEDSDIEELSTEPAENEDFETWRSRFAKSIRNSNSTSEQQRQIRLNRRRERLINDRIDFLGLSNNNRQVKDKFPITSEDIENKVSDHNIIESYTITETVSENNNIDHKNTMQIDPIKQYMTENPIMLSTNITDENTISQWIGFQESTKSNSISNITRSVIQDRDNLIQRRGHQPFNTLAVVSNKDPIISSDNQLYTQYIGQSLEKYFVEPQKQLKGDPPPFKDQNVNIPQTNLNMDHNYIINQNYISDIIQYAKKDETLMSTVGIPSDFNITIEEHLSDTVVSTKMYSNNACINNSRDYENCSSESNQQEKSICGNYAISSIDTHKDNNMNRIENIIDQSNSNNINNTANVDYENIHPDVRDAGNIIDYRNTVLKKHNVNKSHKKCINGRNISPVAAALRSIHLTIIGDIEESNSTASVVGTGRLAAALCRANGRATILPYNHTENQRRKRKRLPLKNIQFCPLQLISQPGLAGRRARLDIIERFACLQYFVSMTVIVTPCILLIDNNWHYPENLQHAGEMDIEGRKWSLEDEYEYRRRRFYYRCAGAECSNSSDFENEDEEQKNNSISNYPLVSKKYWAAEKRQWLNRLAKYRAAALDKWIRTAADAKQAVGDVYGYRALMSALCSDRIQSLRDAWTTLRRLYTSTAVEFESRLRPEFLGHHANETLHCPNNDKDNDIGELLQLPPNATIPDATALAVFYDHIYNDGDLASGNSNSICRNNYNGIMTNDCNNEDKNYGSSTLFTSPLLLSPFPWSSINSGINSGFGASVVNDYGLRALHELCTQYSEWVQQNYINCKTIESSDKLPILQLDRFRNNFETLLRQYDEGSDNEDTDNNENDNILVDGQQENNLVHCEASINDNRNDHFPYERLYEEKVERSINVSEKYEDDSTVICSRSNDPCMLASMNETVISTEDKQCGERTLTTIRGNRHHRKCTKKNRVEDRYFRWINKVLTNDRYLPAPLNTIFRTELHVRLFWPPTILLRNVNDIEDQQTIIPAYALGTTSAEIAALKRERQSRNYCHVRSLSKLNRVTTTQLNQATQDMRYRYAAMDKFLDRACAYSISAFKETQDVATTMKTTTDNQQHHHMSPQ